ncbi:hypothetical protein LWI29_024546 [Acer saccharum]|uniref:Uncharacterized protein n=1 Tax=Acer saccharum TaxID=4024 RepID=A0AA39VBP8_ACESA|nr:hypothetical protein LWI29_024546 [Acer saccharum]
MLPTTRAGIQQTMAAAAMAQSLSAAMAINSDGKRQLWRQRSPLAVRRPDRDRRLRSPLAVLGVARRSLSSSAAPSSSSSVAPSSSSSAAPSPIVKRSAFSSSSHLSSSPSLLSVFWLPSLSWLQGRSRAL